MWDNDRKGRSHHWRCRKRGFFWSITSGWTAGSTACVRSSPFGADVYKRQGDTIVVGGKNYTEQRLLCELASQAIEAKTDLKMCIRDRNIGDEP